MRGSNHHHPYDAPVLKVVTEFSRTGWDAREQAQLFPGNEPVAMSANEGVAGGRGFTDLSPCVSGRQ